MSLKDHVENLPQLERTVRCLKKDFNNLEYVKDITDITFDAAYNLDITFVDQEDVVQTITTNLSSLVTSAEFKPDIIVDNYNELLLITGQSLYEFAQVNNSQGTRWLPGSFGGTYYGSGLYYWNGTEWKNDNDEVFNAFQDFTIILNNQEQNLIQESINRVQGDEGSVTIHNDILNAGSGQIITDPERILLYSALQSETVTSLDITANILTYTKEDGTVDTYDLSLYLDDSNLARIVNGVLDSITGIATFTRDDNSTFTINLSSLLDNQLASEVPYDNTSSGLLAEDLQAAVDEIDNSVLTSSTEWATILTSSQIGDGFFVNLFSIFLDTDKIASGTTLYDEYTINNGNLIVPYIGRPYENQRINHLIRVNFNINVRNTQNYRLELRRTVDDSVIGYPIKITRNRDETGVQGIFSTYTSSVVDSFVTGGFYIAFINESGSNVTLSGDIGVLITNTFQKLNNF